MSQRKRKRLCGKQNCAKVKSEENCEDPSFWEFLPANIVWKIFTLLKTEEKKTVALVCQKWKHIVYSSSLWKDTVVVLPFECSTELLEGLKARKIRRVSCPRGTKDSISTLFSYLPNLISLGLGGFPHVGEFILKRELSSLTELRELGFIRCGRVTDALLRCIAPSLEGLTLLMIEDCNNFTSSGFNDFIKYLTNLDYLDLTWCENLNATCLMAIADNCPNLSTLILKGCDWVTTSSIKYATEKLRKLVTLDLRWNHGVRDEGVRHIVHNLPVLKTLELRECDFISSEVIEDLVDHLPNLTHFSFSTIDDENLEANEHENLRSLMTKVAKLSNLKSLQFDIHCGLIDSNVEILVKTLPNLTSLDLGFAEGITDISAKLIGTYLKKLRTLSITSSDVSDAGIIDLATNLGDLTSLDLRNCALTNEGIRKASCCLTKLKHLTLHADITSLGVKYLTENMKHLVHLDLMDCSCITNSAASLISRNLPNLEQLNLSYCRKIGNTGKPDIFSIGWRVQP